MLRNRLRSRREEAALRRRLWSPPGHWLLLGLVLLVVAAVVTFQGVVTHTIGPSSEPFRPSGGPATLEQGRAVLVARGDQLEPIGPAPGRRIALTFDDGPDPRWTRRVADVLERHRVPAAFFVVGSQAARHPDIVRWLVRDGHEIGNHTFTHSGLVEGADWTGMIAGLPGATRWLAPRLADWAGVPAEEYLPPEEEQAA